VPSRISDSQVHIVLAAAMLVSAGFSLWLSRGTTFTGDELNWIIDTPGLDLDGALQPPQRAPDPRPPPALREAGPATLISSRWLPWLGLAAVVLVAVTLLNDPPGARDRGLELGAWIRLAGAAVLAVGGLLSFARVSLVVSMRPADAEATKPTRNTQTT
jgi:hypothetical protein